MRLIIEIGGLGAFTAPKFHLSPSFKLMITLRSWLRIERGIESCEVVENISISSYQPLKADVLAITSVSLLRTFSLGWMTELVQYICTYVFAWKITVCSHAGGVYKYVRLSSSYTQINSIYLRFNCMNCISKKLALYSVGEGSQTLTVPSSPALTITSSSLP